MEERVLSENEMNDGGEELVAVEPKGKFRKGLAGIKRFALKIGKRNLIISASVLLIGAAVVLNFVFFGNSKSSIGEGTGELLGASLINGEPSEEAEKSQEQDSYFASAQLSRKQTRDQALAVLLSVVDSQSADKEAKEQASLDISRITTEMEAEANIETLLKSKGFEECIAVVGDGMASIIVRSDGLLPNELSQIKEIVWEQAGVEPVGIKIIEQSKA